jgi:hypothetical protein
MNYECFHRHCEPPSCLHCAAGTRERSRVLTAQSKDEWRSKPLHDWEIALAGKRRLAMTGETVKYRQSAYTV